MMIPMMIRRRAFVVALGTAVASMVIASAGGGSGPGKAFANGAFPDSNQLLLPVDRPNTFILGTNFGIVTSVDGGATWTWVCEHGPGDSGSLYQHAPPPGGRVYTLGGDGSLAFSDDLACTWKVLSAEKVRLFDYFVDPTVANRVLLLGTDPSGDSVLLESTAEAVEPRTLLAPGGDPLLTLESAASDPLVIYATMERTGATGSPKIMRSDDGGKAWTAFPAGEGIGAGNLWIAAVDPENAQKIYLRVISGSGERLGISEDGGKTLTYPLTVRGAMSAFVRLDDKTLLVGALDGFWGGVYTSMDGGKSFSAPSSAIRPRAFANRGGKVYAATDNALDGFALAESSNRGATWRAIMSFRDVAAIASCAAAIPACADSCRNLVAQAVFSEATCPGGVVRRDAGPGDAASDAPVDASWPSDAPGSHSEAGRSDAQGAAKTGACACRAIGAAPARSDGIPGGLGLCIALVGLIAPRFSGFIGRRRQGSRSGRARGAFERAP
jgi:photosystem II stability/assembly factor-like uncharacterized protein